MKWTKTKNRYICFIDIMGFKNTVASNTHNQILKQLHQLTQLIQRIDNSEFGRKKIAVIRTVTFSDSIILITENDTVQSAAHLLQKSGWIMRKCFEIGIPIKGSLTHGKFTADFDTSLFFGQPLIDAFLLQEQLHLYSIVIHNSFESKLKNKIYGKAPFHSNIRWYKYKTPLKGGSAWHYHLNWLFYPSEHSDNTELLSSGVDKYYSSVSGNVRQYVDHTDDFVKCMQKYLEPT